MKSVLPSLTVASIMPWVLDSPLLIPVKSPAHFGPAENLPGGILVKPSQPACPDGTLFVPLQKPLASPTWSLGHLPVPGLPCQPD